MPATITYPGVYVEEEFSLSMSIAAGATAVPVIACRNEDGTDPADALYSPVRINSWLDFVAKMENRDENGVIQGREIDFGTTLDASVRAYFENGGGYCYLLAANRFAAEIPKLDDVTLLVAAGRDISTAVNTLCQDGKGYFAVLDGSKTELISTSPAPIEPATSHAALYYPWLRSDWAVKKEGTPTEPTLTPIDIPPSAAVAGLYCSVDRERGVWKAPANVELKGGLRPRFRVTDDLQGKFNEGKAVNMIREFRGTGPLVWGSRTLQDDDNWRYVPVRRLFDTAQRDIKRAMATAMFEPNSSPS